jgi:hypothetical protein
VRQPVAIEWIEPATPVKSLDEEVISSIAH